MTTKDDLQRVYFEWLKERTKFVDLKNAVEITTPLIDRHNDFLQIYAIKNGNSLRLTDNGYILSDLEMSGIDVKSSPRRREMLTVILNRHGVSLTVDDELCIDATFETFPQHKHMLLQAMLAINDMFMTSRSNVVGLFLEDVENYFVEKEVIYVQNVNFTGKSGLSHSYDFVLPKTKSKPERVVQTFNNPSRQNAEVLLFSWNDTRSTRKSDSVLYAILNDADRKVNADVISALKQYEVETILWSQRDKHLHNLTA
ncbi:DUF1829 domain-containing protein [Alicyclobacillus ferrooxydans]|uniref:DUF1828 domain-containing protein n=1 Tax=Alicyclobacillus ferrooxydans TaxID=471514 RepID=A0A0P9CC77_9BACL|nr:DUF1829 domain-containing protein [Alicyclobacillus ferrooxydans]KPV43183.1 hypothetical protein AN477_13935 [Alicyclobacillus ferrooxydans]